MSDYYLYCISQLFTKCHALTVSRVTLGWCLLAHNWHSLFTFPWTSICSSFECGSFCGKTSLLETCLLAHKTNKHTKYIKFEGDQLIFSALRGGMPFLDVRKGPELGDVTSICTCVLYPSSCKWEKCTWTDYSTKFAVHPQEPFWVIQVPQIIIDWYTYKYLTSFYIISKDYCMLLMSWPHHLYLLWDVNTHFFEGKVNDWRNIIGFIQRSIYVYLSKGFFFLIFFLNTRSTTSC